MIYTGRLAQDAQKELSGHTPAQSSHRITLDNTLDERLRLNHLEFDRDRLLIFLQMLSEIRTEPFGKNDNRKFYT